MQSEPLSHCRTFIATAIRANWSPRSLWDTPIGSTLLIPHGSEGILLGGVDVKDGIERHADDAAQVRRIHERRVSPVEWTRGDVHRIIGGVMDSPVPLDIPAAWLEEFEAAARRPLAARWKYAFIHTYKPVLDDAGFRAFDTTEEYRRWCEQNLPDWLGYGRI